jgi:hypothetical protein
MGVIKSKSRNQLHNKRLKSCQEFPLLAYAQILRTWWQRNGDGFPLDVLLSSMTKLQARQSYTHTFYCITTNMFHHLEALLIDYVCRLQCNVFQLVKLASQHFVVDVHDVKNQLKYIMLLKVSILKY